MGRLIQFEEGKREQLKLVREIALCWELELDEHKRIDWYEEGKKAYKKTGTKGCLEGWWNIWRTLETNDARITRKQNETRSYGKVAADY